MSIIRNPQLQKMNALNVSLFYVNCGISTWPSLLVKNLVRILYYLFFVYLFFYLELFENWQERAKSWGMRFVQFFLKASARIYIHIFVYHGKDIYNLYGPLERLSQQGFEAANHHDAETFFKHTPRGGGIKRVPIHNIGLYVSFIFHILETKRV